MEEGQRYYSERRKPASNRTVHVILCIGHFGKAEKNKDSGPLVAQGQGWEKSEQRGCMGEFFRVFGLFYILSVVVKTCAGAKSQNYTSERILLDVD